MIYEFSFILSLFPPLGDCGMKFYKEQYTKIITHTHTHTQTRKEKLYYPIATWHRRKKNDKENKNKNIYTWGCPFEYDLM